MPHENNRLRKRVRAVDRLFRADFGRPRPSSPTPSFRGFRSRPPPTDGPKAAGFVNGRTPGGQARVVKSGRLLLMRPLADEWARRARARCARAGARGRAQAGGRTGCAHVRSPGRHWQTIKMGPTVLTGPWSGNLLAGTTATKAGNISRVSWEGLARYI